MNIVQRLFYGLGEMAYAVACADGKVQSEEKMALHNFLRDEFKNQKDVEYSKIIFNILEKDKTEWETAFQWAIHEMKVNYEQLTNEMKDKFIRIVQKIAEAFPPVTDKENELVSRFTQELNALPPAPVYHIRPDGLGV